MRKDCPKLNGPHKEDNTGPKKFDVQPQMQISLTHPNMAITYDQVLGVIKTV